MHKNKKIFCVIIIFLFTIGISTVSSFQVDDIFWVENTTHEGNEYNVTCAISLQWDLPLAYESFTVYDIDGKVLAHKEAMNPLNYIGEELYVHNYEFTLNDSDSEPYSIEVQLANQNDICVLNDTIRY